MYGKGVTNCVGIFGTVCCAGSGYDWRTDDVDVGGINPCVGAE